MSAVMGILKKIMVPIVAVLVTVGLGIGLLLSGLLPFSIQLGNGDEPVLEEGVSAQAAPAEVAKDLGYYQVPEQFAMVGGIYYETGQRIVNLADPGGFRFLRISIVLEFLPDNSEYYSLAGEKLIAAQDTFRAGVDRQRPLIDDVVLNVLTSKKFDEVFTVEGKENLRTQLREELNRAMPNRHVQRVMITDFVVQ
ncbi:MAG: flagellar basal body-associated FliL family protein [Caldilineaceae bacterium]|nr:flagellar basal body-associated FliL family protein [Caldilineaceae bacterium]